MFIATDSSAGLKAAYHADKGGGPYYCPGCEEEVMLKQGYTNAWHFAHGPDSTCSRSRESDLHLQCKYDVFQALVAAGASDVAMETGLAGVRPDVNFTARDGTRVAVEIQVSDIALETIRHRTALYTGMGMHIVWVCPQASADFGTDIWACCQPKHWQLYLHNLYGRRLFVLQGGGQTVVPVLFRRPTVLTVRPWFDTPVQITDLVPFWGSTGMKPEIGEARLWGQMP